MYAWHKQFLEEREAIKNEGHRHRLLAGKVVATILFYFERVLYIDSKNIKAMRVSIQRKLVRNYNKNFNEYIT